MCAALSESYNLSTSAIILFEMTKRSGSPKELTPSFAQWEALVRVCSSTFCQTTLGIRIDQMLRLSGCDFSRGHLNGLTGHPQDIADVISAIGNVTSGDLVNIQVVGGPACSWVGVFADFVLGLRVSVRASEGQTLFVNFDTSTAQAQIELEIGNGLPEDRMACIGRSFSLRNGNDFIRNFFHGNERNYSTELFLGGKLPWSSVLRDTFGATAENLLNAQSVPPMNLSRVLHVPITLGQAFVEFFVAGAAFYTQKTIECTRYTSMHDFVSSATAHITELEPLKQHLLRAASQWGSDGRHFYDRFFRAFLALCGRCRCVKHMDRSLDRHLDEQFCSVVVAETILVLSYLLGRTIIVGSLNPRRAGLLGIYRDIEKYLTKDGHWRHSRTFTSITYRDIKSMLMPESDMDGLAGQGLAGLFSIYISLFSGGENSSIFVGSSVSAVSDGKIYCFAGSVRELSDCYEKASTVHIGAGMIQSGDRLHYSVFDESEGGEVDYETQQLTTFQGTIAEGLALDTTSPELRAEVMVEERICLTFWYRLYSSRGNLRISPSMLVKSLGLANSAGEYWRSRYRDDFGGSKSEYDVERSVEIMIAHGEGSLPNDQKTKSGGIIVRPHHNNMLGRCAAIALSPLPKTMINKPEELDQFARHHHIIEDKFGRNDTFILI